MSELNVSKKDEFFKSIKTYIFDAKENILIISPYIKTKVLEKLLSDCTAKTIIIITTWNLRDFQFGSSDLELYNLCKNKGVYLYINNRVHLKALIKDFKTCIFGSANISQNGLGLINNSNYELFSVETKIGLKEKLYFKKILNEAILVNDEIYNKLKKELAKLKPLEKIKEIDLKKIYSEKDFLISALPMSYSIEDLYHLYSNDFKDNLKEKKECAMHDIILYNIPPGLNKKDFKSFLSKNFFKSKFIVKLLDFIGDEKYFGRVKEWIQKNCTDVPVPSRRSLTGNIQVLFMWIVKLSDGIYKVDRPGHSERIFRVK